MRYILSFVVLKVMFMIPAQATNSFLTRKAEGWHWYEEIRKRQEPEKESEIKREWENTTPTQKVKALKAEIKRRLHLALVEPTETNLASYISLQKAYLDHAEKFQRMWQRVIYRTPSLDETVTFPVSTGARKVYLDVARVKREKYLQELAQFVGFIMFVKGSCPYCHAFAPTLKSFSKKYGFEVFIVTLDGQPIEGFDNLRRDNGIKETLNVTAVPALYGLNTLTHRWQPIAFGMISEQELAERLFEIYKVEENLGGAIGAKE